MYGKGWKKIAGLIKTRTVVQIRTHAQKYFLKLSKARQHVDNSGNTSLDGKPSGAVGGRKVIACRYVYVSRFSLSFLLLIINNFSHISNLFI